MIKLCIKNYTIIKYMGDEKNNLLHFGRFIFTFCL